MKAPKTAVIPAAGKGTRFLPATKAIPKEMLPLLDTPLIHHCIEELAEAGVEKIIIVSHKEKTALQKYFSDHSDLKALLEKDNKTDLVNKLERIENFPEIVFAFQEEQLGLAHAIYSAKEEIGEDNFFVLLPDEIFIPEEKEDNPCIELLNLQKKMQKSCISLLEIDKEKVSSYGVAKINETPEGIEVLDIVEKPKLEEAPSNYILPGRYLFSNLILDIISKTPPSKTGGEVYLTDAMVTLSKESGLYGVVTKAPRFDGGSVSGFLEANIYKAMQNKALKENLLKVLNR